ncbi:glycosyltransferase family 4 protein [Patescibacteria group bacterium]|nr:glycosyltransferase family 4 protein [Patescibacteria group bacterium]
MQIIGDGPQRRQLETSVRQAGLTRLVSFLGEKPWPETISYLKATDIFVNPSYTEGLPTAVLEAAACGCAIIATNVGGTPEIIVDNHSGLLVPPRAPTILAAALQQLMVDNTKRQRLGRQAKQTVTSKFDWQHSIARYRTLLKQVF